MATRTLARDELWELATIQHGYVTAQQALDQGVDRPALDKLVQRGTLERAAFGVYRFPKYPVSAADQYMLAVLWTRAPEAALSHETALAVYEISDILPNRYHVTVGKHRRLRRENERGYEIHYEDLDPKQIGWWEEVPTVKPATAIAQCIDYGTPTYLLRQALERGHRFGRITRDQQAELAEKLEARDGG